MKYDEFLKLYKNNEFRKIDAQDNCKKFYLLRSISKAKTLKEFSLLYNVEEDLNKILSDVNITELQIINFIKEKFRIKDEKEITYIEAELNKMQNFDWGGSLGNSLEKNIINNYVKKIYKYEEIENAVAGAIQKSVYGYTLNSWYNHWSSILIEEIFNRNDRVLPTVDLVGKIDFFIDSIPFDLKVTYFPEKLMKEEIGSKLMKKYGSKSELTIAKKMARKLNITIPMDLNDKALTVCLYNLLKESFEEEAKEFINDISVYKKEIIEYYKNNPNKLIIWLYENQGVMRFDAANRFYLILVDSDNVYDSWKLKRNVNLLKRKINEKLSVFETEKLNKIVFHWEQDEKDYTCISDILFIIK